MHTQQLILNRYRPITEAGAGSFGSVQVAWDTRMRRKVAIKCIELDGAAPGVAGFGPKPLIPGLDEARAAARFSDASIVGIYDFEVQDLMAYLIMEYVEGITLGDLLRRYDDRITLDIIAAVFSATSRALEIAHAHQILHLDIKPDNILINRQGQVKVADFGLAMLANPSGIAVADGGTIGYMPPEQIRQEVLDERCDEWALASVMYEMLSGVNPFLAPDLSRAEAHIKNANIVVPSCCWDGLDPAIDDVIFYALDPDREQRYATISDFAEELEPFLGDPKSGSRALASIVNGADEEDEKSLARNQSAEYTPRRLPLRDRITARQRKAASRVCAGVASGLISYVALMNIFSAGGYTGYVNPLFWALCVLVVLVAAFKPHGAALIAYVALSLAFVVQNQPVAGYVLLAAVLLWWYFVGRKDEACANVAMGAFVVGGFGLGQLVPIAAGLSIAPVRAMGTTLFTIVVGVVLAACGSSCLFDWNMLFYGQFGACGDVAAAMAALLLQKALWPIAISWMAAALVLSLLRSHGTRFATIGGMCVAGACLLAGISFAAQATSNGATWLPAPDVLSLTLLALVGGAISLKFVSYS